MHLPQAPDIRILETGTPIHPSPSPTPDLTERNLTRPNRRGPAPKDSARPAADSVQGAIQEIISR